MKLVKLSLVAALAAGSLSALNAVSLEDAIKNVDFTGNLRYRYDTASAFANNTQSSIKRKQRHGLRAQLNTNAHISDEFRVFGQAQYGNSNEGGYGSVADGNRADTQGSLKLRQAYLEYVLSDYATSASVGRQVLGTIWTDDFVGIAGKLTNTSIEGVTLAAFWVDGFEMESDGDEAFNTTLFTTNLKNAQNQDIPGTNLHDFFFRQNLYGAAAVTSFDLGGQKIDAQLWYGFMQKRASLYALDVKYSLDIAEDLNWGLRASYLGNSVDSTLKDYVARRYQAKVDNGTFYRVEGDLKGYGFNGTLGYLGYGKKDAYTVNTVEDTGKLGLPGKELFYSKGSNLTGDKGENAYAYAKVGYTLPQGVSLNVHYLFGATKVGALGSEDGGGKKQEILGLVSYDYNKALNFQAWYSYLDASSDLRSGLNEDNYKKNTIRLQALYKF
ncbi:hypothetical protein DMB92_06025 [Campylobacter sp. MIT 99-7217]|uniref:major outer membrane protein n=1 Tax=Campylobacter sp. MIT 99-7217 TaxID=535091 RepID=UPI00115C1791|nr:major outer membrane protein [Campylobacter sp. MIT 99-7217]TQR31934.1 hypothetical protein DMB92_06025 [Campylobacter sp. MIT 99-7217]